MALLTTNSVLSPIFGGRILGPLQALVQFLKLFHHRYPAETLDVTVAFAGCWESGRESRGMVDCRTVRPPSVFPAGQPGQEYTLLHRRPAAQDRLPVTSPNPRQPPALMGCSPASPASSSSGVLRYCASPRWAGALFQLWMLFLQTVRKATEVPRPVGTPPNSSWPSPRTSGCSSPPTQAYAPTSAIASARKWASSAKNILAPLGLLQDTPPRRSPAWTHRAAAFGTLEGKPQPVQFRQLLRLRLMGNKLTTTFQYQPLRCPL